MNAWQALADIDGFAEGSSIFSDDDDVLAYFVNGTQVANFATDADDGVALRLTRKVWSAHRADLTADARVRRHRPSSDWIVFTFSTDADLPRLLELAELTAAAHRPHPGTTLKPPPTGAALARRRRFH